MQNVQPVQRVEVPEEDELQVKLTDTVQCVADPKRELVQQKPIQKQENNTGMPDNLKAGLESLSGFDLSDVRVQYNSDKPAQLQALAYAQGNDIHIGPGQEKHLPHEGWHVVQQKQGRVQPTMQMRNVAINDDSELEKEADVMGERSLSEPVQFKAQTYSAVPSTHFAGENSPRQAGSQPILQAVKSCVSTLRLLTIQKLFIMCKM